MLSDVTGSWKTHHIYLLSTENKLINDKDKKETGTNCCMVAWMFSYMHIKKREGNLTSWLMYLKCYFQSAILSVAVGRNGLVQGLIDDQPSKSPSECSLKKH